MKSKKFVIVILAAVGVAIVAMVRVSRHQPVQKPPVSQQAAVQPKTMETPGQLAKKSPPSAQAQTELPDSSPSQSFVEEAPTESFVEDSIYQPLKELVSMELEVNWDEALKHPQLDDTHLSDSQKETINESPVPVLLPDEQKLLHAALITTGSGWYAASMNEDDLTVTVSGASKVALVPDSQAAEPPELGDHMTSLSRVDGIVEVSFNAFGIYYDVTVECFDHQNDPRCAEDAYILELVDGLKLAPAKAPS